MLALLALGCTVEAPGLCHFKSGDADVHLEGVDGGAPQDGAIYIPYSGMGNCVHSLHFDDGSELTMTCTSGNPVTQCELVGSCVDPETESNYPCQGTVNFQ